jgi:hypothetical protein
LRRNFVQQRPIHFTRDPVRLALPCVFCRVRTRSTKSPRSMPRRSSCPRPLPDTNTQTRQVSSTGPHSRRYSVAVRHG